MARVVLVAMAGILRDIVRGVVDAQPDMTVVGEVGDRATLEQLLGATQPDTVIWHVKDGGPPDGCCELLAAHPQIRILTVRAIDGRGSMWELRPQQHHIGELSPRVLTAAIRRSAP